MDDVAAIYTRTCSLQEGSTHPARVFRRTRSLANNLPIVCMKSCMTHCRIFNWLARLVFALALAIVAQTTGIYAAELVPTDRFMHAGLAPEAAARAMTVPPGFSVSLFAGEPDVTQPIAMAIDDRGRLWIAEAHSYPVRLPDD